ncbi:MAG: DUF4089 domain-containing protein [Hydrogenophaga sp.]|uniref:DUF4089 domain-containing protein n=1 Tax=Hydrogenophaga sp. TaxID=1904254 RepID=UPI001D7A66FB|nr:DUF4089 domain-containing protein [Hydrogenophaga sp.]MBX3609484.1 DUF4089 domain-containing protein [Hydrogenophaga sp.]
MNEPQTLAYVQAVATALELPLDAARAQRVATHLQRTTAMAQLLQAFPLDDEVEPAEVFCPAPYPHD